MNGAGPERQAGSSRLDDVAFSHGGVDEFLPPMFPPNHNGRDHLHTIDFGASPAFFGELDASAPSQPTHAAGSPASSGSNAYAQHSYMLPSRTALSGVDPISTLGHGLHPALTRSRDHSQSGFGMAALPPNPQTWNDPAVRGDPLDPARSYAPLPGSSRLNTAPGMDAPNHQSEIQDRACRAAEVERRNKLREQKKARRKLEILKQVEDGFAALKAEVSTAPEPQSKQDEADTLLRRKGVEREIRDEIRAIQEQRALQHARIESDRQACRGWLSDLKATSPSAETTTSGLSVDAIDPHVALGRQIRGFWKHSRPSASSQWRRNEVIADVQRAIDRHWPGQNLQVAAFGSSVTGLVTASSDLDLVLLDPTRPYGAGTPSELCGSPNGFVRHKAGMPDWYNTKEVAIALRKSNKFGAVFPISGANVPIVKMSHRRHGIPADININERFGLFNSQLICAYADLQPDLVRPLIFFLKHWYSRHDLNDPSGKSGSMTFSSYTIALTALQVLQLEGVLPNLQAPRLLMSLHVRPSFLYARPKRPRGRNGKRSGAEGQSNGITTWREEQDAILPPKRYDVTFASSQIDAAPFRAKALEIATEDAEASRASSRTSSRTDRSDRLLGKMLVAYFRFYSQLNPKTHAISVASGSPIKRRQGSHPGHVLFDSADEDEDESAEGGGLPADDAEKDVWAGDELVIQDPFIIDRNTSRNIKSKSVERWQSELERVMHVLSSDGQDTARSRIRMDTVTLVLDLCVPQDVVSSMDADGHGSRGRTTLHGVSGSEEPWRQQEETEARARQIARQAAEKLRSEKRQKAKRARPGEARILRQEAAMVQEVMDGMESGQVSGLMSGNERHENWRMRGQQNGGGPGHSTAIPFTFSVARSLEKTVEPAAIGPNHGSNGLKTSNHQAQDLSLSPTESASTSKTDDTSSSEDLDLVGLRLRMGDGLNL